jgi:hypothetical protein
MMKELLILFRRNKYYITTHLRYERHYVDRDNRFASDGLFG